MTKLFGKTASAGLVVFCVVLMIVQIQIVNVEAFVLSMPRQEKAKSSPTITETQDTEITKIKFKVTKISDGQSDDGTWWKIVDVETSDGHPVYEQRCPYASTKRAQKQFDSYIKLADKVLWRRKELDSRGEMFGERALALLPRNSGVQIPPDDRPHYVLFWHRGSVFNKIVGEDLRDVAALESRMLQTPDIRTLKEF